MNQDLIPFRLARSADPEPFDEFRRDLAEAETALLLVAQGTAARMTLCGLPHAEEIAPLALAWAQQAGIEFAVERREGHLDLVIGSGADHD